MEIINNPFNWVIAVAEELYPNIKADIQFNPNIKYHKILWWHFGHCGETIFPEDGSTPLINISTNIPFVGMIEVLAHEIAHVIVGERHEHDIVWQKTLDEIKLKYEEKYSQRK